MVFPVVMHSHQEGCVPKNQCFRIVVLEKTLEGPMNRKEIKLVNPKGNHSWLLYWKDWCWHWSFNTLATWWEEPTYWRRPWCWERLRQEGKGVTEDEMVGWHHWLNNMSLSKCQDIVKEREAWSATSHVVARSQTWLSDWTTKSLQGFWAWDAHSPCLAFCN